MTKPQRLRTTAEGFIAGLVACGYQGPWRWSNMDWEFAFYQAWASWTPATRTPDLFPRFEVGGHGRTSQPRELLWQLKNTSPFHDFASEVLPEAPLGLSPQDYLEIWANTATPDEWQDLAAAFLAEMQQKGG